jgi:acyl-CoA thioesterase FadM
MYPLLRLVAVTLSERRKPPMDLFATHELALRCLPWDLDGYGEMNNGRILTLYDLGRFALGIRVGLADVLRRQAWGLVVAGASVRYRARITGMQRVVLRTRVLGWDARFLYLEQGMWRGETCCNHALLRAGVTRKGRLVPVADVAQAMGHAEPSPALPNWVAAWAEADGHRPWPPMAGPSSSR